MIMKRFSTVYMLMCGLCAITLFTACNNDQSYADRLNDERNAVNAYLADHRVEMKIPEDSVFEVGENAPFYRIDADGNVFMQVLNAGNRVTDRAKKGEPIYFRYSRYNLATWYAPAETRTRWMPRRAPSISRTTPCRPHHSGVTAFNIRCCSWASSVR